MGRNRAIEVFRSRADDGASFRLLLVHVIWQEHVIFIETLEERRLMAAAGITLTARGACFCRGRFGTMCCR